MVVKNKKIIYNIFIYGNCQQHMIDSEILSGAKFISRDIVKGWKMIDLSGYPIAYKNNNIYYRNSYIMVEMYEIDEVLLRKLDKYYLAPKFYDRTMVKSKSGKIGILYFADTKKSRFKGRCEPVFNGNWVEYSKNKKKIEDKKEKKKKERKLEDEKNDIQEANKQLKKLINLKEESLDESTKI